VLATAAALATAATSAIARTSVTAAKSHRTGRLLVTGRAWAAVGARAPLLYLPIDLTSAEAGQPIARALATGRASAAARTLAIGARASRPTGQASATGPVSVTDLGWGSLELAAARGRTLVRSAQAPQELRLAAASPAVLASARALFQVWATIGREPASRLKTEGAR
jgi:hypothetical protein